MSEANAAPAAQLEAASERREPAAPEAAREKPAHGRFAAFVKRELPWKVAVCYLVMLLYIVGGNFLTINLLPGARLPVRVAELASVVFCLCFLPRYGLHLHRHEKMVSIWLGIGIVASLIGTPLFGYTASELVYGVFYPLRIALVIVTTNLVVTILKEAGKSVFFVVELGFVVVCAIGFFQLAFYPVAYDWYAATGQPVTSETDPHIGRLVSTYVDPNFLSACLLVPMAMALFGWRETGKWVHAVFALVYLVAIIDTVSRSGLGGLAIVVAFFCLTELRAPTWKKNLGAFVVAAITAVYLFASSNRVVTRIATTADDPSALARVGSWDIGLNVLTYNPVTGIGYNMIGAFRTSFLGQTISSSTGYGNDSSLLLILIATGIVGFAFFAACVVLSVKGLLFTGRRDWLDWACVSVIVASLAVCNFNNVLFYVPWMFPYLLLRGSVDEPRALLWLRGKAPGQLEGPEGANAPEGAKAPMKPQAPEDAVVATADREL